MVLSGCSSDAEPAAAPDLSGTSWTLSAYAAADGAEVPAVPESDGAPLTFGTDGSLSGSTGCNRFAGTFTQDGASLTVALGPMTLMACDGPVADQESAVIAALGEVASFTADGDLVLLSDGGDALLTYAAGLTSLSGTSWQATGINNGVGGVESNAVTSTITAAFGADDKVSGSGGCNTYSATYTTGGTDEIVIGPVAATKMACPEDVMTVEGQYFAALGAAATYTIEGNSLTLRDADGATQVAFVLSP